MGVDPGEIRSSLTAGTCPWCDKGPFRSIAKHTNSAHGIDRRQLRELAGLPWTASICAPDLAARRRELNARPERVEQLAALTKATGPHGVSPAGAAILAAKAVAITNRPGVPSKLTDADRARIRQRRSEGLTLREIGIEIGVSEATVHRVLHGRRGR